MKILQVMSGAEHGGAEEFFVRLTGALSQTALHQRVVIRDYPDRVDTLVSLGVETEVLPFRGRLLVCLPLWRSLQLPNRYNHLL